MPIAPASLADADRAHVLHAGLMLHHSSLLEVRMSKPPLPSRPLWPCCANPAVITTLRRDGQPVSATWYPWDDGRVLVSMDQGQAAGAPARRSPGRPRRARRKRLAYPPSASPATSRRCVGPGPGRHRPASPALHGQAVPAARPRPDQRLDRRGRLVRLGRAKGQQPAGLNEYLIHPDQPELDVLRAADGSSPGRGPH